MEKKKNVFWLGIAIGVAVMVLVGLVMMSVSKDNDSSKTDGGNKVVGEVKKDNKDTGPVDTGLLGVEVGPDDHVRGNPNASVTIVEFSDFECPFCARFHDTMKQVMEAYPEKVRWVYKHFPLDSIHRNARNAAEASECAGEQDSFWAYADELMENQSNLSKSIYNKIASDIGLDAGKFESCLSSGKYKSKIEDDYQVGVAAGVRGTPGNFINGKSIPGAVPFEKIKAEIDAL